MQRRLVIIRLLSFAILSTTTSDILQLSFTKMTSRKNAYVDMRFDTIISVALLAW